MEIGFQIGQAFEQCIAPWVQILNMAYHCYLPDIVLKHDLNQQGFNVGMFDEVIVA